MSRELSGKASYYHETPGADQYLLILETAGESQSAGCEDGDSELSVIPVPNGEDSILLSGPEGNLIFLDLGSPDTHLEQG